MNDIEKRINQLEQKFKYYNYFIRESQPLLEFGSRCSDLSSAKLIGFD